MASNSSISSSKYICTVILTGLVTFVLCNVWLGWVMPRWDSTDTIGKSLSDGRFHKPVDVLFIGDSRTNQGLDPNAFEQAAHDNGYDVSTMNIAAPGMQGPFFYFMLKDHLDHVEKRPKAIIANISFYLLGGDQWFQDIYRAYYTPSIEQVLSAISKHLQPPQKAAEWYIRTRIPALRYRKRMAGLITIFAADPLRGLFREYSQINTVISQVNDPKMKGYISFGSKTITEESLNLKVYDTYKVGFHKGYQSYQEYLKDFFALANRYRIHVIIYTFPWPKQAGENKNWQKTYAFYQELLRGLAKDNPYIHFVKYNFLWTVDDIFADPLHVNQKGADRLSALAACWLPFYGIVESSKKSKICKTTPFSKSF